MGADGHLEIYDLKKIREELTNEQIELVVCSVVYIHKIFDREVLTMYWGDNLYYQGDDYSDREPKVSLEEWNHIWSVINKHKITSWEVWT